ncbi:DMT family transporter [Ruegeria sp.]|uniref:DMT family transporter n=1 Tax=Ruegeria sp. TaxID=1879320 RepID=UPI00230CDE6C|nr:DMT family transporter [Ruegeria sp.]MDA7966023.1 DMT family transporter [Ruegeria sp.]
MSALTLGLLAAVCWGVHDLAVRYVSQSVSVIASLMATIVFAAFVQLGLGSALGQLAIPDGKAALYSVFQGLCYLVAGLSMFAAFQRGPVRLVAPLVASYPVLSVAMAIWRGASVTPGQWLAVIAIGIGVSIVAARPEQAETGYPARAPTILLSVMAAAGFAGAFALGQYATELSNEYTVSVIGRAAAILGLAAIAIATGKTVWPGWKALPLLCVMGTLDSIALLSVIGAGGLPDAQYASVVASVFGLLTVVLAWILLNERMLPRQWLGCLVAFAGIGYLAF